MSMYPKTFSDPIEPSKQSEEVKIQFKFSPIRAATTQTDFSFLHDPLLQRFINMIQMGGNKDTADDLMSMTLGWVKHLQIRRRRGAVNAGDLDQAAAIECDPIAVFHQALRNVRPQLMLRPIRRSGTWYQVPKPINEKRANFDAMKWFREYGRDKHATIPFYKRMAEELVRAANNEGHCVRMKHERHKTCEANRAYAHFVFV